MAIDAYMVWTASWMGKKPEAHTAAVKASEGLTLGEYVEWVAEHQPDVLITITRLGPVETPICVELRPADNGQDDPAMWKGWKL